ncbi:ArsR family transcription regulator [Haloferax gibbonsii]|uniref:ArsR family transcription regulator n=1 Tax=Haloferax gibbonsii TaxID=35746 RepID=A0A871BG51_HALGI|nr:MarR family winged helix-turn-helix transcriptional regulator [Haloferax gibbonsii]QOS12008.1 ArsR family transcription regulator [Haloferax gibbonsii]
MLSKTGVAVLNVLSSGREATVQELAADTGNSRKQVYRVVDEMIEAGLVRETRGRHNLRVVRVTDDPVVEAYRRLASKLGHVEWPELLSPATVRVCWFLDEPRRVTAIADRLGITRQAVHKALSPLKNRAMLAPSGPEYALADDLRPLLEFARAVVAHEHRVRVRALAPSATVEWYDPKRALVRVHDPEDTDTLQSAEDWELTGLARFQAYGLRFFLAGEPAFWYAPDDPLTPADVVCHTLVLDADSRRSSYALLLIEKEGIDREALTETATWYGVERTISQMYAFLDENVEASDEGGVRLPSPGEYAALKDQYGVA